MSDKQGVNDVAEREFRRHYGQIYRFVRRRTHDHDRAEELTQQVFADAAASLGGSVSPTLALLYTIAKRRFADEVRRDVHRRGLAIAAVPEPETREYGPDLAAALSAGFARLPDAQRQVAVLKLVRGARFRGDRTDARCERSRRADALRPCTTDAARGARTGGDRTMTLRDPEIIEALREEPELLALADAFADTQRQPSPRRLRRVVPRVAAVAAVAAAVALVALLAPGGGGRNPVLGRALAAIGDGRVLHLVTTQRTGTVLVDLKTGHRTVETAEVETWADRDFARAHLVMRVAGQVADLLIPNDLGKHGAIMGNIDPAFSALWTGYRKALANGNAKLEGKGVVGGRPVYWLRFPSFEHGLPGTEVAIDRRTYKPMLVRSHFSRTGHSDARVLTAETIPFRASEFRRLGPSLLADTYSSSGGSSSLSPGTGHTAVKAPWLTPGARVAGLTLASVGSYEETTNGRTAKGVELVYGQRGPQSLTIDELPESADPTLAKYFPRGSVSVQAGEGSDGHRTYRTWGGELVKDGIRVTIDGGTSERAVVEIARALHRAP